MQQKDTRQRANLNHEAFDGKAGQICTILFKIFPNAILRVILFFAGSEPAIVVKDIGDKKSDFYVMLIVAAFAMWNMGVAFLVGVIMDSPLRRGWVKV